SPNRAKSAARIDGAIMVRPPQKKINHRVTESTEKTERPGSKHSLSVFSVLSVTLWFILAFLPDPATLARMAHSFPIARRAWKFAKKALANWRERHRHPFNFAVHLLGIPAVLVGIVLLFVLPWYWGVGLLVLGSLFQWVGHRV